jgi:hypothetical protein
MIYVPKSNDAGGVTLPKVDPSLMKKDEDSTCRLNRKETRIHYTHNKYSLRLLKPANIMSPLRLA